MLDSDILESTPKCLCPALALALVPVLKLDVEMRSKSLLTFTTFLTESIKVEAFKKLIGDSEE